MTYVEHSSFDNLVKLVLELLDVVTNYDQINNAGNNSGNV